MDVDHEVREAMRRVRVSMARLRPGEADDIVQETMLRAVRSGIALDAEPWLRTVARRVAIDNSRRAREVASGGSAELELMAPSRDASPEDQVLTRETVGAVREALDTLPPRYRDALVAYVEEDESAAGVARRFGLSDGATWTLLCRARARLRSELERVGYAAFIFLQRFGGGDSETAGKGAAVAAAAVAALAIGGATLDVRPPQAPSTPERVISPAPRTATEPVEPAVTPTSEAEASRQQQMGSSAAPEVEVPEAPTKLAQYQVGTCLLSPDDDPVGVELSVEETETEEQRSLLQGALKSLPEPLRHYQRYVLCGD